MLFVSNLRIMVCGSIGSGGIEEIRRLCSFLHDKGFDIVNHIDEKEMDYSDVKDFRNKKKLSHEIVEHDLTYVRQADILIILPSIPSSGTAIEMYVGKKEGKKIILLTKDPVPTPWLVDFSDHIVSNQEELLQLLYSIQGH